MLSKQLLGRGSSSSVYECKNTKTGAHYAAKQYTKRLIHGMESLLQSEFQILKRISSGHKNVLSLIDYFETENSFYLVTNLGRGGDLFDRITTSSEGRLTVDDTKSVLKSLLSALAYLHSNNICHRDVKAENVIFMSRSSSPLLVLLADFGLAFVVENGENEAPEFGGTMSYMAPECFSRGPYSFPVDMWAIGVLTYFMLCGYMPFDCDTNKETKLLISKADYVFEPEEYWNNVPDLAKSFIAGCLKLDPHERLTASEALHHPFVSGSLLHTSLDSDQAKQIQDAVWNFHNLQKSQSSLEPTSFQTHESGLSSPQSHLSLRYSSASSLALDDMDRLWGDRCKSPNTISRFGTPVVSNQVSPVHSQIRFVTRPKLELLHSASASLKKASFIL